MMETRIGIYESYQGEGIDIHIKIVVDLSQLRLPEPQRQAVIAGLLALLRVVGEERG